MKSMKVGDKILIARPDTYPLLICATVHRVRRDRFYIYFTYSGERCVRVFWREDEGLTWCRGHDLHAKAADALRVAVSLS